MASQIRSTLESIGAVDPQRVRILSTTTRDRDVPVWIDDGSGVIFIDDFYVGPDEYESGSYRGTSVGQNYEDWTDTRRRVESFRALIAGRSVLDFGCGSGSFLKAVRPLATNVQGVELQTSFRESLNDEGLICHESLSACSPVDVATLFHVLEHLPDPLTTLMDLRTKVNGPQGAVIIEVPHARDFLITRARNDAFLEFTLWSQHLILHTRDSLRRLLTAAGFADIDIHGVQRYGLANHLTWLIEGRAGGHKSALAALETDQLRQAYASALAAMDASDTLVAIAR